ncbi:PAS domain S-box protein [Halovenus salina]|uniref:histidine kinase n=1 Tax=Halovenus salina TaxID=1510225 RepID=A0ABD5W4H5_9EURY
MLLSREGVEAFREAGIAVGHTRDTEPHWEADCLLVSMGAFEDISDQIDESSPPVVLVLESRDADVENHRAASDFLYQSDLTERPELVAQQLQTVIAAQEERQPQFTIDGPDDTADDSTYLARLFEEAPDSILVHDETGKILNANGTAVEKLGYPRDALTSMHVSDIQAGTAPDEFLSRLRSLSADEMIIIEGEHRHADGTTHPVETWVNRVEAGSQQRFVAIARDDTERREYEERLETQRDNLETLNQVVRHDIRNDLQLVDLYADLLEDHIDDDEGCSHLEKLQEGVENAVDLTTTARELAEVMLSTTVDHQQVRLDGVLLPQLEKIRESYPDAVVTLDGGVPSVDVIGNDMLDSVFRNLLKNAIQHNDKAVPAVAVSGRVSDDTATVRIADNGPGVPDCRKSEIFGRGESGLDSDGTGIGLYLVQSLVEGVDGDVWVEDADRNIETDDSSHEVGGAAFVVELPLA